MPDEPRRLAVGDRITRAELAERIRNRKPVTVVGPTAGTVERFEELEDRWVIYTRPTQGSDDGQE